jgi:hypothetical protein
MFRPACAFDGSEDLGDAFDGRAIPIKMRGTEDNFRT